MKLYSASKFLVCSTMNSNVGSFGTNFQFHVCCKDCNDHVAYLDMQTYYGELLKMNLFNQTVLPLGLGMKLT